MRHRVALVLALLLASTGCAVVTEDLTAASARAYKAAGMNAIPVGDPLPLCLDYLLNDAKGLIWSEVLGPSAGLVDSAVKLYILDSRYQEHEAMDRICGPVAVKILRNIGKKAIPPSGWLPGS